jgi:hypothetical protein
MPWLLGLLIVASPLHSQTTQPLPEEIQRNREEMERKKLEYRDEKARVEDLNRRVEKYRELRETIPFTNVQGTSNLIQVYVNRHDVREVARQLYDLTTNSTPEGFEREYWRSVLFLNQADKYLNGRPEYGTFDPQHPENNVAIFPNIRKRGLEAVVAEIATADTAWAMQLTSPVVAAYKQRLEDRVLRLSLELGEPPEPTGPERMSGENVVPLFGQAQAEPKSTYPPRRITDETRLAAAQRTDRPDVDVNQPIALDPAPPAWALQQEVTMLGSDYQGYNVQYQPGNFELLPEGGAMAFFGGRDGKGNPRTQPGLYFSFNQKLWRLLLLNQTAFAAFSAADAPAVNGGILNAGVDFGFGAFSIAGMVGYAAYNTVGKTDTGISFTGELRYLLAPRVYLGAIYTRSDVEIFQVEAEKLTGIIKPGFAGFSLTVR